MSIIAVQRLLLLAARCFFVALGFLTLHHSNLLFAGTPTQRFENWAAWRGPLGTGVAPRANPPITWSETNNIKWKIEIPGNGSATPIIWDHAVFVQTAIKIGANTTDSHSLVQFVIICLDRETGKTIWQKVARTEEPHEGHHEDHGFASSSPVTDGRLVFAWFGSRGLYCYDFQGALRWKKDFGRMQIKMGWGEGNSPALFEKTLVVNWDHEGNDFIAALDSETGKELWRRSRDEETTWATPLIVEDKGKIQVITAGHNKVRSYDLRTGEEIWNGEGLPGNVIPSPVAGDGIVYLTSNPSGNGRNALLAIQVANSGDAMSAGHVLWTRNRNTPYVSSPLLFENRLYFFSGLRAILSCLDAKTGQVLIDAEPVEAFGRFEPLKNPYASPVAAHGRVYLVGRNGMTFILNRSDKFEVLAGNKLDEDFIASPALAGKEIYLRGRKYLYCIKEQLSH